MEDSKKVYKLWKLLDDIDTASDIFKGDYKGFSKYVYRKQQLRHDIISSEDIDKLYDKYYKRNQSNMETVASILGVKMGQYFIINELSKNLNFRITIVGFECARYVGDIFVESPLLNPLLNGTYTITRCL